MQDLNPIMTSEAKEIGLGVYNATLQYVSPWEQNKYQSEEKETVIKFKFYIADVDANKSLFAAPWNGPKSKLVLLLHSMTGKAVPEDIRTDREKLWQYCKSLIGRPFAISIGLSSTGKEKITSVVPVRGQARPAAPQQALPIDEPPIDDIPF